MTYEESRSAEEMTGTQWFGIILSVLSVLALILGLIAGIDGATTEPSWVRSEEENWAYMMWGFGIAGGGFIGAIIGFALARRKPRTTGAASDKESEAALERKVRRMEKEIEELKRTQK